MRQQPRRLHARTPTQAYAIPNPAHIFRILHKISLCSCPSIHASLSLPSPAQVRRTLAQRWRAESPDRREPQGASAPSGLQRRGLQRRGQHPAISSGTRRSSRRHPPRNGTDRVRHSCKQQLGALLDRKKGRSARPGRTRCHSAGNELLLRCVARHSRR